MSVTLRWSGLDALKRDLKNLPRDLTADASGIIAEAAEQARQQLVAEYESHAVTFHLAEDVYVANESGHGLYGVAAQLRSDAPHAWLFEHGSQARHYYTHHGVKKAVGSMPGANIFIPLAQRIRRGMFGDLKRMLTAHGLGVRGDA